jgi:small-conductance mechanosensitive channel
MLKNQERSKYLNFALKALDIYSNIIALVVLWSLWALFFSSIETIIVGKVILSFVAIALSIGPVLVDYNESHASNPLWTGHARFHLVWQVCALAMSGLMVLSLMWLIPTYTNLLISISLLYMWIICFFIACFSMSLYGGKLNDVNGVPPIKTSFFGKQIEIDHNLSGITGASILCTYACALIFL